ncbi:MAG: methyltransferase domain-containing protein [Thiohalomonadales bacterium]
MSVLSTVKDRYAQGANEVQPELCCPVDYDKSLLAMLPQEIIDKDYGCGDPSRYVKEGDTVLDLGSGGGKICYMAAQLVGEKGHVIGVDMTEDMLALARKYQDDIAAKLGGQRVTFYRGHIQNLALNLDAVDEYLSQHPVNSVTDMENLTKWKEQQCHANPLIKDNSVDLVISNCVLNLVAEEDKQFLISEIFRVLKPGGRVAISDIVSDEIVPQKLRDDAKLWSGCISGAFHEKEFLNAFVDVGFNSVAYDKWDAQAWQVVAGIEFRSVTLTAVKGHGQACIDRGHAAIYLGPYASVSDDEGHLYPRGERMAICERTYNYLSEGPQCKDFITIAPTQLRDPVDWCAPPGTQRPASETKGATHGNNVTTNTSCC